MKLHDYESLFPPTRDPNATHFSISDVQRSLEEAQASYGCRVGKTADVIQTIAPTTAFSLSTTPITPLGKAKAKVRLWLSDLSAKILHYDNIFDVMVQHHPEYVSLAWGTFKLLFIVSSVVCLTDFPYPFHVSLCPFHLSANS